MANRTDPTARSIRGTNPQNLVNRIVRERIYRTTYWKEQCFGLTAETLVDKAMELDCVGGTFGGTHKATPFLCLVVKMLQIQPEKEIVVEFIKNEDHRYVRILGAFYLRLTGTDTDVYLYLEPLYNDYRKLVMMKQDGDFVRSHVDEFIDNLLTMDYCCGIAMPRIKKRSQLESKGSLELRRSALEDDFEEEEEKEEAEMVVDADGREKDLYRGSSPHGERDRERKRDCHRYRDRDYRDYERDRDRDRYRIREKDYGGDREREGGRDRERRDRERDRRRRWSQSRSRSREREEGENGDREETKKKKKQKSEKKDDGTEHPDAEIAEANTLRAQLGLRPLRL